MATQLFGADLSGLLARPADKTHDQTPDETSDANPELHHQDGSAFRGLFFALLFNLFLLLAIAMGWEIWRGM